MDFFRRISEASSHFFFQSKEVHIAFSYADAINIIKNDHTENKKRKALMSFFPTTPVIGCAPPPGSTFKNGQTTLPTK
ncbi:MAG: hypothetical protein NTZ67_01490 [Gammaproteobacteria bacterium]|nr:hypothetical protein [Gammaproteobacteria bacterium]